MVDPDIKRWLLDDEEKKIKKNIRGVLIPLTIAQLLPAAGILWQIKVLSGTLLHSYYEPDYGSFFLKCFTFILISAAASAAKHIYFARKSRHVKDQRNKSNEDAYLEGPDLVLSGVSDGKDVCIRIPLSTIHMLESKDGRTSFRYIDKDGRAIGFSCLDYYSPQIAALLANKGIS